MASLHTPQDQQVQNHRDDMLVAIGESQRQFLTHVCDLGNDPNVQTLEMQLTQVIMKLPQASIDTRGFVECCVRSNADWHGAREVSFNAATDDTERARLWKLIVRFKKQKDSNVSPFYVDMQADANTSMRSALAARTDFVRMLREQLLAWAVVGWWIKPNESLLSPAMKEVEKLKTRLEDLDNDRCSIPSTIDFLECNSPPPAPASDYACCCDEASSSLYYRTHAGKKCKDGSYDMRTLCNRGHCKQCGGVQKMTIPPKQDLTNLCCRQAVIRDEYRVHQGTQCKDGSYDMRFKENRNRCKWCGTLIDGQTCGYFAPKPREVASGSIGKPNTDYSCCCAEGGRGHPMFRTHTGQRCKDGSYDMRCKENKPRCKECGGKIRK